MSNPLASLQTLLEQHERQRDEALAAHLRLVRAAEAAKAQAAQLHAYRREYEQRWSTQFQREASIEILRSFQSFAQRLTEAVETQDRQAEFAFQRIEAAQNALREAELRCASVRKLIERRVQEQRRLQERRDQKTTDEMAARKGWERRRETDSPFQVS
jgi:flagellar protein FliJ